MSAIDIPAANPLQSVECSPWNESRQLGLLVMTVLPVLIAAVRVDRVDVRDYDLAAYRHRIGIVPQEAYLFPGTIRDTIAYGRPDTTDAQIEAAARAVGADQMIARLPGGYAHPVDERGRNQPSSSPTASPPPHEPTASSSSTTARSPNPVPTTR